MKKSLLLICVLILSVSLNAMAADTKMNNQDTMEASDKLIEICENFFET